MQAGQYMLYEKLRNYAATDIYPMHMPGHKRNVSLLPPGLPYGVDITEIHGFDDLHEPEGVLRETAELAAALYGSGKAFLLVNGSTVGILAAIGAHTQRGDKVLMTRSCHRAVHNAASLFGLAPVFLAPETDDATGIECSIDPADVESAFMDHPNIRLVVITSPTYEGVISDVAAIADIAHSHGVPLFVDQAHGAHLDFSGKFRGGAIKAGADIVVMSLHKTLPALTQCSLLHTCGGFSNVEEIKRLLSVLQTSSPSYVLMASIDSCLRLLSVSREKLFTDYERNLEHFDEDIKTLRKLAVLCYGNDDVHPGFFSFDPGKLVIVTRKAKMNGFELADALRSGYNIELELARAGYAIAMTSVCDTPEGFRRLAQALNETDRAI